MKYQLNPLMEFVGHAAAALMGGIAGYAKHDKMLEKDVSGHIDSITDIKIIKQYLMGVLNYLKSSIQDDLINIHELEKLLEGFDTKYEGDPDYMYYDTEEDIEDDLDWYRANLKELKIEVAKIQNTIKNGDISKMKQLVHLYRYKILEIQKYKSKLKKKHRAREAALFYGGAAGGGLGYHYGKKAFLKGLNKVKPMLNKVKL